MTVWGERFLSFTHRAETTVADTIHPNTNHTPNATPAKISSGSGEIPAPSEELVFDEQFSFGPKRQRTKTILVATPHEITAAYLAEVFATEENWTVGLPRDPSNLMEIIQRGDVDVAVIDESWMTTELIELMPRVGPSPHGTYFCVILSGATELEALDWMRRGSAAFFHEPMNEVPADTIIFVMKSVFRTLHLAPEKAPSIEFRNSVGNWIEMTAPSDAAALEQFQRFFAVMHSTSLTDEEKRMLHLAINEIGMNAIEWGNKQDESRRFRISYAFFPHKILIRIEDEGAGFNPREVPDPTKDPAAVVQYRRAQGKRLGGYGLALVRNVMDTFEFSARGNIVYMEKRLKLSGRQRSIRARLVEAGELPPLSSDQLPAGASEGADSAEG